MGKYRLLALTNCLEGREEEFNKWYDERHVPEVTRVPGVLSGKRFQRVGGRGEQEPKFEYLVIYDVDVDDPDLFLKTLDEYLLDGRIEPGRLYRRPTWTALYKER
jgi:hypothetical protein